MIEKIFIFKRDLGPFLGISPNKALELEKTDLTFPRRRWVGRQTAWLRRELEAWADSRPEVRR